MVSGGKDRFSIKKHPGHSELQALLIHPGSDNAVEAGRARHETLQRVCKFLGQDHISGIGYGNLVGATVRDHSNVVFYMESADLVVMCPGWRDSVEACLLFYIAAMHKMCILEDVSFKFLSVPDEVAIRALCRPEVEEHDAPTQVS